MSKSLSKIYKRVKRKVFWLRDRSHCSRPGLWSYMEKAEKDTYDLPEGNATHHVFCPSLPFPYMIMCNVARVV